MFPLVEHVLRRRGVLRWFDGDIVVWMKEFFQEQGMFPLIEHVLRRRGVC